MKPYSETKIAMIGFGFLMGYLTPCCTRLYDSAAAAGTHMCAVTADEAGLKEKREKYPFPILLNDNRTALEQLEPDIILFAPPPSVAPGLAREVLKPYFDQRREMGEVLPDLYAFPPSPPGKFYLELLGEDVHVCNILPNMMNELGGVSLNGREGNSHVTLPDEGSWPEVNKRRLEHLFSPLGGVVYVPPAHVLDVLAALCVIEIIPLLLLDLSDAFGEEPANLASAMRAWHQRRYGYYPSGSTPCSRDAASPRMSRLLRLLGRRWMGAAVSFLTGTGMDGGTAEKLLCANMDLKLHCCQVQSREKTEADLRGHATKGGVAERARACYELLLKPVLAGRLRDLDEVLADEKFFDLCESILGETARVVAVQGRRLDGETGCVTLGPEHAAMLFALFVRSAGEVAQERGMEAAHRGLLLYARQRGGRMAKRARANGDEPTMLHYMAYGEWSPPPGTMVQENVALEPSVVTHVSQCPWYTVWERLGFLTEGAEYCKYIDRALVKGYNPDLELDVTQVRTCGAPYCEFIWNGCALNVENAAYLERRKDELGDSCRRDWLYHTRHTYSAMRQALGELPEGEQITAKAMDGFETLYGRMARTCVEDCAEIDFYAV